MTTYDIESKIQFMLNFFYQIVHKKDSYQQFDKEYKGKLSLKVMTIELLHFEINQNFNITNLILKQLNCTTIKIIQQIYQWFVYRKEFINFNYQKCIFME